MSLVADYSDSSDSESTSSESNKAVGLSPVQNQIKLPSASDALDNAAAKRTGVVLSNPFLEAELHKTASLERHVKMVNNDAHLQLKNGRKICWNYRKGRCRFGTNCQYAHDSDLSVEEAKTAVTIVTPISSGNKTNASKRKRPGLSDAIEPGKKVMKSYQQQHQMQGSGVRHPPN